MNAVTLLHYGWAGSFFEYGPAHVTKALLLVAYAAVLAWGERAALAGGSWSGFARQAARPDRLVTVIGLLLCWWWPALSAVAGVLLLLHLWTAYLWLLHREINPSIIFVGSFVALIALGAAALKLPAATPPDSPISWTDAAFTATSAACVTGLIVRDTPSEFTRFGHTVILILIQLGGLGMILFGALVAVLLGSSMSLRAVRALGESAGGVSNPTAVRRLVVFTFTVVIGAELIGAAVLYWGFPGADAWPKAAPVISTPGDRLFTSVFFSISAFCNAGFSMTPDSLQSLRAHWTAQSVMAALITIGAIGLPVYVNLSQMIAVRLGKRRASATAQSRLSLHSKITLVSMAALYAVGLIGIAASGMIERSTPWSLAVLDGHFMSVTARTAGFETVAPTSVGPLGRLIVMVLMFIGGSPGSTAGGVKTVVFAVLMLTLWATVKGRYTTEAYARRISDELVRKAATLLLLHVLLVVGVLSALFVTDGARVSIKGDIGPFEQMLFEAVSACSTVGLSLGVTPELSAPGRWVLVLGMFLGRVGALAFLVGILAITHKPRPRYEYPAEPVVLS